MIVIVFLNIDGWLGVNCFEAEVQIFLDFFLITRYGGWLFQVKKEDMYYMDDKTKKKESVIDDM